jgi:NTE family protein
MQDGASRLRRPANEPSATGNGDRPAKQPPPARLCLALQGGGAHGAFTWGVLDRLLEEPGFRIEAISGSSAGALNAAVLASAFGAGGRQRARAALRILWQRIAGTMAANLLVTAPRMADLVSGWLSPYQFNPLDLNPLRAILSELVDVDRLRARGSIRLFIAATNLHTGEAKLFSNADLSIDALIASTSLPWLHQAVKIGDSHYWDGGFVANPPLLPLVEECQAEDILLVRLNPSYHAAVPVTARDIRARVGAIVFDSPLQRELEAIAWLSRAARKAGALDDAMLTRLGQLRLHTIRDDDLLYSLDPSTKMSADWPMLERLHEAGRAAAGHWLAQQRSANRRVA